MTAERQGGDTGEAARGLAALRAEAALATTPAVQEQIARLLGAGEEQARTAVALVGEAGLLGHGIALVALVQAARRGTDVLSAIEALAGGAEPPVSWSAYEARVAAEEAAEEAALRLRDLTPSTERLDATGARGLERAVAALRARTLPVLVTSVFARVRSGAPVGVAVVEQGWLRLLWTRAGGAVVLAGLADPLDEWAEATLTGADPERPAPAEVTAHLTRALWTWSTAGVLGRAEDYVDPFAA